MQKLSEVKGEDALDMLADIIEPATEIMTDPEVAQLARDDKRAKAVAKAIKNHKRSVIEILALLNGEDPDTYEPSILALPVMLLRLFNDPDLVQVFSWQSQTQEESASGSATENTEETEEK